MASERKTTEKRDANRDPITGEPGIQPVGAGVGAVLGGAAAGAAAGMAAGPIGTAEGGVVGGLAGKAAAEKIDPTAEEAYWKENYAKRPYYSKEVGYDAYGPAYRYGWESRSRHAGSRFDDLEPELWADWERRGRVRPDSRICRGKSAFTRR